MKLAAQDVRVEGGEGAEHAAGKKDGHESAAADVFVDCVQC